MTAAPMLRYLSADATTAALLAELAAGTPRLPGAKCVGQHQLYDTAAGKHGQRSHRARAEAMALCLSCPVLQQCRRHILSLSPRRRPVGIAGGMALPPRG